MIKYCPKCQYDIEKFLLAQCPSTRAILTGEPFIIKEGPPLQSAPVSAEAIEAIKRRKEEMSGTFSLTEKIIHRTHLLPTLGKESLNKKRRKQILDIMNKLDKKTCKQKKKKKKKS